MPNRLKKIQKFKFKAVSFLKNAKQRFFAKTAEKAKNLRNSDVHAKQHFLMPYEMWNKFK